MKLPQAANSSDKPETQEQTVVAITPTSGMFLNGVPVRGERPAQRRSRRSWRTEKEKIVLIKGDEDAPYSAIMAAMDRLREANIENIGLITETQDRPAGEVSDGSPQTLRS